MMYRGIRKQRDRVTASTGAVVIKKKSFPDGDQGWGSCKQRTASREEKQASSIASGWLFSLV